MNKIKFNNRLKINNNKYKDCIQEYINLFCEKQNTYLEFNSGHILCFGDSYFTLDDIIFDLDNNCKKDLIFKWQKDGVKAHMKYPNLPQINYNSYNIGLRYKTIIKHYLDDNKKEKENSKKP